MKLICELKEMKEIVESILESKDHVDRFAQLSMVLAMLNDMLCEDPSDAEEIDSSDSERSEDEEASDEMGDFIVEEKTPPRQKIKKRGTYPKCPPAPKKPRPQTKMPKGKIPKLNLE
jgi:hypothetical protein